MTTMRRAAVVVMGAALLLAVLATSSQAAKVANPGNVTFTFDDGFLRIKSRTFEAASSDDPATATGTVAANGNLTISSFNFPDLPPIDGPLGPITISINVLGTPTGNVNPQTGVMTLNASVRVDVDGNGVGSNCRIEPINLALRTGTTSPPGPNTPITGSPYNPANGKVTLVDNAFSVPGAQGCSTFPVNVNNEINNELSLPSAAGNNEVRLTATSTPILARAIVPAFTATPSSGAAPLDVDFDASSTFHSRPIASYQWDLDGDGSLETTTSGPTTSMTYTSAGNRTVKLRVTDADGDFQETTRVVMVSPAVPDLTITKSHTGDFVSGNTHTYSIGVSNTGGAAATGTVTVTDTLPADMTFAGSTGGGWSCGAAGQIVTCASEDDIAPGSSAAPLELDVVPGGGSVGIVTNVATVSTAGDPNASNDTAEDVTTVIQPGIDLAITKTNDADDGFFRGRRATYILSVANVGNQPAVDRIRVVDALPDGVTYVSAAGGLDWTCSFTAPQVRCFSDEDVAPGETLQDIRIRVDVDSDAPDELLNDATVNVNGDSFAGNDATTHSGTVEGFAADYALTKSHTGTFVVGEPGFYSLNVANVGFATGGSDVTVLDQLPAGLTYNSTAGAGWSCSAAGQDVTCEHAGQVEAGDSLPTLTLRVDVGSAAAGTVTNTASVSSADDFNVDNDVATDPTEVRGSLPDLAIDKSHSGNFSSGEQGTYTIAVSNASGEAAAGPTTVTDALPSGLTYVSATGTDWSCSEATGTVTCTYADAIDGGASAPPIELVVAVAASAADSTVINTASLENADDIDASNNEDSDPTAIDDAQAGTALTAEPWLLHLSTVPGTGQPGPAATLTSDGDPVAGETLTFTTRSGAPLCSAVTDAAGKARCEPSGAFYLPLLLGGLRYKVNFAGDDGLAPASAEGEAIRVYGNPLL